MNADQEELAANQREKREPIAGHGFFSQACFLRASVTQGQKFVLRRTALALKRLHRTNLKRSRRALVTCYFSGIATLQPL